MTIMQVSGECFPYSKTGGLADMVGALSKALAVRGTQVQVVTPLYRGIARKFKEIQPMDWALDLEMGDKVRFVEVAGDNGPQASTVHLIGKHNIVG